MEAAILKLTVNLKITKLNLFIKSMHTHTQMTNVIFVYYANNLFKGLVYEYYTFSRLYWGKNQYPPELVTSQPHWLAGSQLHISKFSVFNNFLVCSPICMRFTPNRLVLKYFHFGYGFAVSDPFPLMMFYATEPKFHNDPMFSDKQIWANKVDPNETATELKE